MNERRWKQYFRQAGKYLYCDTSQKDIFEKQIRAAIADLQNENPMISYEECIAIIGTPSRCGWKLFGYSPRKRCRDLSSQKKT